MTSRAAPARTRRADDASRQPRPPARRPGSASACWSPRPWCPGRSRGRSPTARRSTRASSPPCRPGCTTSSRSGPRTRCRPAPRRWSPARPVAAVATAGRRSQRRLTLGGRPGGHPAGPGHPEGAPRPARRGDAARHRAAGGLAARRDRHRRVAADRGRGRARRAAARWRGRGTGSGRHPSPSRSGSLSATSWSSGGDARSTRPTLPSPHGHARQRSGRSASRPASAAAWRSPRTASRRSPTPSAGGWRRWLPGGPQVWKLPFHAACLGALAAAGYQLYGRAMRKIEAGASADEPVLESDEADPLDRPDGQRRRRQPGAVERPGSGGPPACPDVRPAGDLRGPAGGRPGPVHRDRDGRAGPGDAGPRLREPRQRPDRAGAGRPRAGRDGAGRRLRPLAHHAGLPHRHRLRQLRRRGRRGRTSPAATSPPSPCSTPSVPRRCRWAR